MKTYPQERVPGFHFAFRSPEKGQDNTTYDSSQVDLVRDNPVVPVSQKNRLCQEDKATLVEPEPTDSTIMIT